ncbi:uncharacterized protein LOC133187227 [Saccostrea echinata]|uniref:uncharacterized protein LOC133187227 n=1 Tax=Saccostrea echinata TaxID=191078 RepID=UPI002A82C47C|nr:uncharacterized protein LOC133187227 [Saccostrea echinata]
MFNLKLSKRISILEKSPNEKDEQIPLLIKETPFFKTSTFHEAISFLKDGGKILCLIGKWGSGKSTTAKKVYKSLTGRRPIVIEDILKFDVSSCQDSIIVEEPLPREDISDEEKNNRVEKIIYLCKNILKTNQTFMIITSTEEAWEAIADEVENCDFDENEYRCIDLNWKNLSKCDRIQIFHTIFQFHNPDKPFSIVEENVTRFKINSFGFPETCALFSKCSEFQKSKSGVLFFNRPLRYLSLYLEKMCQTSREKQKFLVLVYMSLNNMKIDMDKSNDKLWEIFRLCGLNTDSVRLKSIIPWELVVKEEPSVYVLQHEVIKRITLITFGKLYFSVLLRLSSQKDLDGWIKHKKRTFIVTELLEVGTKQGSEMEPFLEIGDEQWIEYQKKMGNTL